MTDSSRLWIRSFAAAFAVYCVAATAEAVVVDHLLGFNDPTPVNTIAPGDIPETSGIVETDPGFYRVPTNLRGGVYLGNQWVLTARHAGTSGIALTDSNGVQRTFPIVPGSQVNLSNPAFFNRSLTPETDLTLFRIGVDPVSGLAPEDIDSGIAGDAFGAGVVQIASNTPDAGDIVTLVSNGRARVIDQSDPNGNGHFVRTVDGDVFQGLGFDTSPPFSRPRVFGRNRVAPESFATFNATRGSTVDNVFALAVTTGNGANQVTRDIIGQFTQFDSDLVSLSNQDDPVEFESQAVSDSSGGPVFFQDPDTGETVLAGVLHAISRPENQPGFLAAFGNQSIFTDLSQPHFRGQIEALLANDFEEFNRLVQDRNGDGFISTTEANQTAGLLTDLTGFSINGDINLDGVVSGDGSGDPLSDDVAAFVEGFGSVQVEGDVKSWLRGDLNLDGVTDLADFVLLRDAYNGEIGAAQLSALLAASGGPDLGLVVPEPGASPLVLLAAVAWLRRRSRH